MALEHHSVKRSVTDMGTGAGGGGQDKHGSIIHVRLAKTAEHVTQSESVFCHIWVHHCSLLSVSLATIATPPGKFRVTVAQRGGKQ